jgi:hypothetical protein
MQDIKNKLRQRNRVFLDKCLAKNKTFQQHYDMLEELKLCLVVNGDAVDY